MANQQILLLNDVLDLGRKGDLHSVKSGYARNFLYPKGLAVPATKGALRMRERLQEERSKKAEEDRKASEGMKSHLEGTMLTVNRKVDPEGHMYGSVSVADVLQLLKEQAGVELNKRSIPLAHPIKATGVYPLELALLEDITVSVTLKVIPEGEDGLPIEEPAPAVESEEEPELSSEED